MRKESHKMSLLRKFVEDNCNPEELEKVNEILRTKEGRGIYKRIIREYAFCNIHSLTDDELDNSARIKVFQKLQKSISLVNKRKAANWTVKNRVIGIAATFLLAVSIGLFLFFPEIKQEKNEAIENTEILNWIVKENPSGKKTKFQLPDGTVIWLNSESTISYNDSFKIGKREIWLNGEAFFEVKKDSLRPFIIYSGELNTQVLGTSFNIDSYEAGKNIKVTVISGKVQVNVESKLSDSQIQQATLLPGEQVTFDKIASKMEIKEVDVIPVVLWREKTLIFENEPLKEVLVKLERWFGVEIENGNPKIQNCLIKGTFQDESLKNILTTIQYSLGFEFEIKNNKKIFMKGGNCY